MQVATYIFLVLKHSTKITIHLDTLARRHTTDTTVADLLTQGRQLHPLPRHTLAQDAMLIMILTNPILILEWEPSGTITWPYSSVVLQASS